MPNDDPKKEEFAAVITTEAPVKAGDEVVIDYCTGSSRASWDMLLQYAFVEGEVSGWRVYCPDFLLLPITSCCS